MPRQLTALVFLTREVSQEQSSVVLSGRPRLLNCDARSKLYKYEAQTATSADQSRRLLQSGLANASSAAGGQVVRELGGVLSAPGSTPR